ncbi:MAG TPA: hypothetical protein DCP25_09185, partial [Chloroflexi bacterium]|nr:hypothetical protein [Chloroflexota bacterium]
MNASARPVRMRLIEARGLAPKVMYFSISGRPYSAGCRVAVDSRTTYSIRTGSTKTLSVSR